MTSSTRTFCLYLAIVLTGLSAGLFYSWAVSVIPGTRRVADPAYLEVMQSINRQILNPAFFLSFFGALVMLVVSSVQHHHQGPKFWLLLSATIVYVLGVFVVTALGNVPLNDQLDGQHLETISKQKLSDFRHYYEHQWNRWHMVRTGFCIVSFLVALAATFIKGS